MSIDRENFRGIHAIGLLKDKEDITLDGLIELAHDPYLPAFEALIPGLVKAYDSSDHDKDTLREPIEVLRNWDFKTSKESVAMTLAHFYGTQYYQEGKYPKGMIPMERVIYWGSDSPNEEKRRIFETVVNQLTTDFGTWSIPWGEVNRYQRLNGDVRQAFDDSKPSIPIGFASGRWGALAAYGARYRSDKAKKIYGTRGNSFVAAVEFGDQVKAKSILAGGQSGAPDSPHFDDQIQMYADVKWKDVPYYKEDILKRAKETYVPGQRLSKTD
jgi:acyl-homoserine lactone acylase PvdQ